MRTPILITTPMPDPDEFAASLGISPERREFLKALAAEIKAKNRAKDTRAPSKKRLTPQRDAALQVEVQHFAEKMLHGKNVSAVEFGGAYRAPGA